VPALDAIPASSLTRADAWILDRLDAAIGECDAALGPARPDAGGRWREDQLFAGLRLSEYVESARRFVWSELADWYVESTKARLGADVAERDVARAVLVHVFDAALRLLHPLVPFITEALWQRLPGRREGELLATASWPVRGPDRAAGAREFDAVQEAVMAIRALRAEYQVAPAREVDVVLVHSDGGHVPEVLAEEAALIGRLARARVLRTGAARREAAAHALLADGTEVVMPLGGLIDVEKECARLRAELAQLTVNLEATTQRLSNERFVSRAPAHVVEAERAKAEELAARRAQLTRKVDGLCGGA
jgi:valyl-tRNA synthetase